MNAFIQITPHDPLVARDGRPFGAGQGNRMRGLPWLVPSVVAGSFRSALVKSKPALEFDDTIRKELMQIGVAGVLPVSLANGQPAELYLPAPNDALAEPGDGGGIKTIRRVLPREYKNCCDFPDGFALWPVMLPDDVEDFKPAEVPAWWPMSAVVDWLVDKETRYKADWFTARFLQHPIQSIRDHVALDADRGAAAESLLFASSNLHLTHMPRYGANLDDKAVPFRNRFAEVTLSARVTLPVDSTLQVDAQFQSWHPLGGERRLVHWKTCEKPVEGWACPTEIRSALADATKVRMVLATPAIFKNGWKPGWLNDEVRGEIAGVKLTLVGVCNHRWKAVSGWSMAPPRGPKAIRRMVPAGSVYFFKCEKGAATPLADKWLESVSDDEQEQRDGFGLALWGTW